MINLFRTFIFTGVFVAIVVTNASAQPGGMGPGGPGMFGVPLEELDLTDAQLLAVDEINDTYSRQMREAHRALRSSHHDLEVLVESGNSDEAAITRLAAQIGETIGKVALMRSNINTQVRSQLTPEQIEKMDQMRKLQRVPRR